MYNFLSIFFLIFFSLNLFAQKNNYIHQTSKLITSDNHIKKTSIFFKEKKWDSILILTSKKINENKVTPNLSDWNHFYRGYSLYQKKLYFESEKEFNLISKNFDFKNDILFNLGLISFKLKNYNKSIQSLKKSNGSEINDNLRINNMTSGYIIGLCYLLQKKYDKATYFLKKELKPEGKDTLTLINYHRNLGNLYYEQYKDDLAIPYFLKAYNLAKKTNDFNLKKSTTKNMAVVEENRKDYKKALVYRKEMERWKDSLNDQNKIYAVAQKEKEFAVKEKQKEVNILQIENKLKETQRNLFIYAAIGLLLLLGVGIYFYREKVKANTIIAAQKENLDTLNATKDKLFSIVSHDLRSSVNALKTSNSGLLDNLASKNLSVLENLLQKNSAIVNGAYSLLDNLLNWALLQTEQGYFNIDKLRLFFITEQVSYNYKPLFVQKELSFENTVAKKDVVFADQESLKIVLRNLLDNAIKFSEPNGSIKIYSSNTNDDEYCHLIVEDTGLGMSEATRLRLLSDSLLLAKKENEDIIGTGLGIQLCKSMIQKNNGKFSIESELGKGTKMIVSLPKNSSHG